MRRTYAGVIAVGLLTLGMAIALVVVLPTSMGPGPEGIRTPILAFELARSPDEIERLFGEPGSDERAAWVAAMDLGNALDFAFLLAYGAVLFFVSRALRLERSAEQTTTRAPRSFGERFAFVAPLADVFENVQLFAITGALGGDYREALGRLLLFTWIKWGVLALVMATWIPSLWGRGRIGRVAAFAIAVTSGATAVALALRGIAAEVMGNGVVVSLLFVLVFAIARFRTSPAE